MALATIVRATGSSYRARRADADFSRWTVNRTLSGGCIEDEIAKRAAMVVANGEPQVVAVDLLRRFGCHAPLRFR